MLRGLYKVEFETPRRKNVGVSVRRKETRLWTRRFPPCPLRMIVPGKWSYSTLCQQHSKHRSGMLAKGSTNVAQRLTRLPPRPQLCLLLRG